MAVRGGTRFAASFEDVFPAGCKLVPDSLSQVEDYDEKSGRRTPSIDKHSGTRVWQVRVMDMDPELAKKSRETVVKIMSDVQPVPPVGAFEDIEFEGLTITPWIQEMGQGRSRMAYSFRATGMRAPAVGARPAKNAA